VAVCEERARTDLAPVVEVRSLTASTSGALTALALAVLAGVAFAIRLDTPAFFDNEGRYAEIAREMIVRRDWITPYLDFTLFLNKPPLTSWLTALVFQWTGPSEWARLVPVAGAMVALYATCRLGELLYGARVGLVAGVMLATGLGFVLEARTLRPDMLLAASVATALLCWQRAETTPEGRARWLAGMYVALGVGVLAKGLVPLVIAGLPIGAVTLREHGWQGIRALRPGLGLVVLAAVVLPWHVAVALRHDGFAWDYVVNQHLLFFLDRKFPRDSEGDTLGFFWGAFAGRAFPWIVLVPLTLAEAVRGAARDAAPSERTTFLLWAWIGGTMLFFSLAPSRLEHYSIPALPGVALVAARAWQRAAAGEVGRAGWGMLALAGAVLACVGGVGLLYGTALLVRTYWIAQVPELLGLARPAAIVVLATGVLAALAAVRRRATLLVASLALGMVPLVAIVLRAEVAAEPLFSWRPVAQVLTASLPPETEIVYEAPEEYQLVGGLVFYTGRRITLLEPPGGFIPPTYLAGQMQGMFLVRSEFERRWRAGERLAFVSDSQRRREDPQGIVPEPFHVIGRFGDRWVLSNVSAAR
jgi:4-amino-4-deoxy-L-arabinose transferase-like glycosyltransferase